MKKLVVLLAVVISLKNGVIFAEDDNTYYMNYSSFSETTKKLFDLVVAEDIIGITNLLKNNPELKLMVTSSNTFIYNIAIKKQNLQLILTLLENNIPAFAVEPNEKITYGLGYFLSRIESAELCKEIFKRYPVIFSKNYYREQMQNKKYYSGDGKMQIPKESYFVTFYNNKYFFNEYQDIFRSMIRNGDINLDIFWNASGVGESGGPIWNLSDFALQRTDLEWVNTLYSENNYGTLISYIYDQDGNIDGLTLIDRLKMESGYDRSSTIIYELQRKYNLYSISDILNSPKLLEKGIIGIVCKINNENVRLRSQPNLDSHIIKLMKKDEECILVTSSKESIRVGNDTLPFYLVYLKSGQIGWIYGKYLNLLTQNIMSIYK